MTPPSEALERFKAGFKAVVFILLIWVALPLADEVWRALRTPSFPVEWVEGGIVLLVSFLFLRSEGSPLSSLGLSLNRRWALHFLLGIGVGLAIITGAAAVAWVTGACRFQWTPAGSLGRMLAGAWLYLAVAFNEELIFRGYGLQRAVRGFGPWPGQILLALVFAYAHWGNPGMSGSTRVWAVLNIFLAGLFFGLIWRRTASLAMPMGIHFGWNWMQGSVLGFGVSGGASEGLVKPIFSGRPEWLSGGAFGLEAGLPCLVLCALATLLTLCWKPTPPQEGEVT